MLLDIRSVLLFLDILLLLGWKTDDGRYRNGYISMVDNCGCEISSQDIMEIILMLFLAREQGKRCFMLPPEGILQISKSLSLKSLPHSLQPFPTQFVFTLFILLDFLVFCSTFSSV